MTADMEKRKRMAVFSGSSNLKLADEIARELGISLGNVKLEKFANGEIYARYQESVRGADVFIVQSVCSSPNGFDVNDNLMELLIMIDAAKRAYARTASAPSSRITVTRARTARPPRASPSPPSWWPTCSPPPAPTTSSPSTCIRTPSRASSTSR